MTKPESTRSKSPCIILSLAAATVIGMVAWSFNHRIQNPAAVSPVAAKMPPRPSPPHQAETTTRTPEEIDATANARPCDGTVLTHLDLSRPPTEGELIAAGNLGEKLTPTRPANPADIVDPTARKRQELDNLAFGNAIQAWNKHQYDDALKLFTEHLQSFPDSPWAAESILHIGCHHQYVARFSEAVEMFDKILETAPKDSEMYHKARLRRSIINIDLGRLDDATTGFSEMMKNDPDPDHKTYASYWLIQTELLKKNETALRDCGQKALSHAARMMGKEKQAEALFQLNAAGPHGFTATELHATALQNGMEPSPVMANAGLDELPVPFIAHYTDRHYVTVESVTKESVRLYDSRISAATEMPRASFEKSWSGFALLMKPAPASANIHEAQNLDKIVGGCCGQPTQPADLGKSDDDCRSCGLPSYSVNPINMNFKVIDTPMWWDAPVGPDVNLTLLFNSQDSLNNYTPFGGKWSFEYATYLLITPGYRVQIKDGDGKFETFTAPAIWKNPDGTPIYPLTYPSPPGDFRKLVQTAAHEFLLTHPDGTVFRYAVPAAMVTPPPRQIYYMPPPPGTYVPPASNVPEPSSSVPLLLSISDRHNNALTITHNSNGAITQIAHSACPSGVWTFSYDNNIAGSLSRVNGISDPFGRSCSFRYDAQGNLTGQTDMGGLSYGYGYTSKEAINNNANYSGQTTSAQLFVASITTPTGTTHIETEPADGKKNDVGITFPPGYSYTYPDPGNKMWTNYRITIRDHLDHPTEYYFGGMDSTRYIRNPVQMDRPALQIAPELGARTEMYSGLVAGKGVIVTRKKYKSQSEIVSLTYSGNHSATNRLPGLISSETGGVHYLEYNNMGSPIIVRMYDQTGDGQIAYSYEANGIDVDTIKRSYAGVLKTLVDYNYYPGSRDLQSVTDVYNRTLTFEWWPNGLPRKITESIPGRAANDVIDLTYDIRLRPYQILLNGTVISTTVYDAENRGWLDSHAGPDGRLTYYSYDDLNRLTRVDDSQGSFTAYDWACCFIESVREGKLVGGAEKTLRRSVTFHDKRALPLFTVDNDGRKTSYEFDSARRMVKLTDPKNQVTEWKYNAAGELTKKIYPDTTSESFTYREPYGTYGWGRIESHTNRRSLKTLFYYEYDGQIDQVTQTDPVTNKSNSLNLNYDFWRRPETQSISGYQGAYPVSGTTTLGHDLLGRLTSIDGPWTDDTVSWNYDDATSSVTRTSPGGVTETAATDAVGVLASVTNPLGTFTHNRGGLGELLDSITHSGGFNTAFGYHGADSDFALHTITSTKPGGAVIGKHTYTYSPSGVIETWKREAPLANPTGPTRQFESKVFYDPAEQVSSLLHTLLPGSSVAESAQHYVYDPAGNIASKQVEKPGLAATMTTFGHNDLNQLNAIGGTGGVKTVIVRGDTSEPASVKVKPGASSIWKDAKMLAGQRFEADLDLATGSNQINVQAKDGSNNTSDYTYALDLAAASAVTPAYDAAGNMTSDGVRGYEWDMQCRLMKITWGAGSNKTTEFRYNPLGQRSERIEKTGTTETAHYYYLYDGLQLLARYQGGTAPTNIDRRYFGEGEQRKNGASWDSFYYCRDHLGSIREVMNSDGTLAARYDYDPYGIRSAQYLAATYADGCELGYTGHITQPSPVTGQTELVMTLFRAYDPNLGAWLSADPIGEMGGMNLYAYCYGNPLNLYDPFGLMAPPPEPGFWSWNGRAGDWAVNSANFVQGFGDAATLNLSKVIRDRVYGEHYTDPCSRAHQAGEWASLLIGEGRLAYAGSAKAISLLGRLRPSMDAAKRISSSRNTLKKLFAANPFRKHRIYAFERLLEKYGSPEAVIEAAGRTDNVFNAWGGTTAGTAAYNISHDEGCE